MFKRIVLLASLVALALAVTAYAGNGAGSNKSSSSSISSPIVVSTATASPTALTSSGPHYGDSITFNVSTTATDQPFVNLVCYQNGALALTSSGAFWGGSPTFTLNSGMWSGGAADCTADLGMFTSNGKWKALASTSFHADA